jgi:hypothetical protein
VLHRPVELKATLFVRLGKYNSFYRFTERNLLCGGLFFEGFFSLETGVPWLHWPP